MFNTELARFQTHLVEAQASPHLMAPFTAALSAFFTHLAGYGVQSLAGITPAVVTQWRTQLSQTRWSPASPDTGELPDVALSPSEQFFAVRCFSRWLWRTDRLAANPAADLRPLSLPRSLPNWGLTDAMAEALLLAPDLATDSPPPRRSLAWRDRAVLNVLYRHGLDAREVLRLTLKSVSVADLYIPRHSSPRRWLALAEDPHPWMEVWLQTARPRLVQEPSEALFINLDGTPLDVVGLKALVAHAALQAGLHRRVSARILCDAGRLSRARTYATQSQ